MMSLVRPPLLQAYCGILAHILEKYSASGLRVELAKRKQTAQLSGLFTRDRLRKRTEKRKYYPADTVFLLPAAFTGRSLGFLKRGDLIWMSVSYAERAKKVPLD